MSHNNDFRITTSNGTLQLYKSSDKTPYTIETDKPTPLTNARVIENTITRNYNIFIVIDNDESLHCYQNMTAIINHDHPNERCRIMFMQHVHSVDLGKKYKQPIKKATMMNDMLVLVDERDEIHPYGIIELNAKGNVNIDVQ